MNSCERGSMHLIDDEGKRRHAVHYLKSLREMQESVKRKEERIAGLRSIAEGMRVTMGEKVSGGQRKGIADIQAELDAARDEFIGEVSRYSKEIAEGYRVCPVEDIPRYACWLHWVERMTWAQVGKKIGYCPDHCRSSIRRVGLCRIYDHMPHHWRAKAPEAI